MEVARFVKSAKSGKCLDISFWLMNILKHEYVGNRELKNPK